MHHSSTNENISGYAKKSMLLCLLQKLCNSIKATAPKRAVQDADIFSTSPEQNHIGLVDTFVVLPAGDLGARVVDHGRRADRVQAVNVDVA